MQESYVKRHVIAALVVNEPGVLSHVAGMFAARGFNIDSLVVGRTDNPEISRVTIIVIGNDAVLEQLRKQLERLVQVVKVADYTGVQVVERDLVLIQVSTEKGGHKTANRAEIAQIVELFRGKIVDVASDRIIIEMEGTEEKIEAFCDLMAPFGILELARTGVIALPRGDNRRPRTTQFISSQNDFQSPLAHKDLPPG